ncbi:predicted protein [Thalassiosira pseudonana CCMP1335]|uniref:RanBP2-type domain-containing protein n=1 Tax=Thalassiosira pseudonana TaxID=35128 RepID=B8C7N1_THAPS|nr:predicted protein [Thalassiosira pseudonana CCMP1335]EED90346.1 predicted protein [Thalassiosira pseudonana CCMP1335]
MSNSPIMMIPSQQFDLPTKLHEEAAAESAKASSSSPPVLNEPIKPSSSSRKPMDNSSSSSSREHRRSLRAANGEVGECSEAAAVRTASHLEAAAEGHARSSHKRSTSRKSTPSSATGEDGLNILRDRPLRKSQRSEKNSKDDSKRRQQRRGQLLRRDSERTRGKSNMDLDFVPPEYIFTIDFTLGDVNIEATTAMDETEASEVITNNLAAAARQQEAYKNSNSSSNLAHGGSSEDILTATDYEDYEDSNYASKRSSADADVNDDHEGIDEADIALDAEIDEGIARLGSLLAKSQLERREKRERKSSVTDNNSSDSQSGSEDGSDDDDDSDSTTSSSSYQGSNPSNFTEDDDDATYYSEEEHDKARDPLSGDSSSDDDKKRISPRQHDPTLDILNSIVDSRSLGSSEFDRSFHSTFQDSDEWSNEQQQYSVDQFQYQVTQHRRGSMCSICSVLPPIMEGEDESSRVDDSCTSRVDDLSLPNSADMLSEMLGDMEEPGDVEEGELEMGESDEKVPSLPEMLQQSGEKDTDQSDVEPKPQQDIVPQLSEQQVMEQQTEPQLPESPEHIVPIIVPPPAPSEKHKRQSMKKSKRSSSIKKKSSKGETDGESINAKSEGEGSSIVSAPTDTDASDVHSIAGASQSSASQALQHDGEKQHHMPPLPQTLPSDTDTSQRIQDDIQGCYWDIAKSCFDSEMKEMGAENATAADSFAVGDADSSEKSPATKSSRKISLRGKHPPTALASSLISKLRRPHSSRNLSKSLSINSNADEIEGSLFQEGDIVIDETADNNLHVNNVAVHPMEASVMSLNNCDAASITVSAHEDNLKPSRSYNSLSTESSAEIENGEGETKVAAIDEARGISHPSYLERRQSYQSNHSASRSRSSADRGVHSSARSSALSAYSRSYHRESLSRSLMGEASSTNSSQQRRSHRHSQHHRRPKSFQEDYMLEFSDEESYDSGDGSTPSHLKGYPPYDADGRQRYRSRRSFDSSRHSGRYDDYQRHHQRQQQHRSRKTAAAANHHGDEASTVQHFRQSAPPNVNAFNSGGNGELISWDDLEDAIYIGLHNSISDINNSVTEKQEWKPTDAVLVQSAGGSFGVASNGGLGTANGDDNAKTIGSAVASRFSTSRINEPRNESTQSTSEDDSGGKPWQCPVCTFINENPMHLICGVCSSPRIDGD